MTAVASHRHSLRDGTAAAWASINPILALSEIGYATDTGDLRVGDGVTAWNDLPNFIKSTATLAALGLNADLTGLPLLWNDTDKQLEDATSVIDGRYTKLASLVPVSTATTGAPLVNPIPLGAWFRLLQRPYEAYSGASSSPVRPVVLVQGHSIGEGTHADDPTFAFPHLLMRGLRSHLGGRDRSMPFHIPAWYANNFANGDGNPPQSWVFSRAFTQSATTQFGHGWRSVAPGVAGDNAYLDVVNSTAVDVMYATYTDGATVVTIDYSADGGSTWTTVGTVNCYSSPNASDGNLQRVTFPSQGNYRVRVTNTSGDGAMRLCGAYIWQGDESTLEPVVIDASHGGAQTADLLAQNRPNTRSELLNSLAPHLIIVMMLVNDYHQNVDPATSKSNLQTYLAACRTALPGTQATQPSFLLLLEYQAGRDSDYTYPWQSYRDIAYQIAAEATDVAVLDLGTLMPPSETSGGTVNSVGLYWDVTHPHNWGHRVIVRMLTEGVVPAHHPRPVLPFRGEWTPSTLYIVGEVVTRNGGMLQATSTFTSGSTFTFSNWKVLTPPVVRSRRTSSVTNPTTTLADTGLSWALDAGTHELDCMLMYDGPASTGMTLQFANIDSGIVGFHAVQAGAGNVTSSSMTAKSPSTPNSPVNVGTGGAGSPGMVLIKGTVTVTTPKTVKLQFALASSNATPVIVYPGVRGSATQVA